MSPLMIRKLAAATAMALTGPMAVSACATQPHTSGSLTCQVSTDTNGVPDWTATFTNNTNADITVSGYTTLFFGQSGNQVGSQDAISTPFTVASNNTYADTEAHSMLAPVPDGSTSCQVTNVSQS